METIKQFEKIFDVCRDLFIKKLEDYGASWRILRPESLTDQIYIKANRIRTIEICKKSMIDETIDEDYIAIINYSIIALIQLQLGLADKIDIDNEKSIMFYETYSNNSKNLMLKKNHDYGEAWRMMRISSYTDLILTKIFRIKQIEDNKGKTKVSEGIDSNYYDIINYSVFALIKIFESSNIKIFEQ